ncbi:hypothetical protein L7F22_006546 [Adiantum nelumboides]|nr:hypothetical protein [Adiantum nelumboides]
MQKKSSIVEVEVKGEGPCGRRRMVNGHEAVGGQAAGAQEVARAAHHSQVSNGVGLANLAQDGDGARVGALRDVGGEDVKERVAQLAIQLPDALRHTDLLRAVGGPVGEHVLEGGGGAEVVRVGPRHIGRQSIDGVEVVGVVDGGVVDGVVHVECEGAGSTQGGGPLPAGGIGIVHSCGCVAMIRQYHYG